MEDLQTGDINLSPEYITRHLSTIKNNFEKFKEQIDFEYAQVKESNSYIFENYNFDKIGECHKTISLLSDSEKKLLTEINKKFSFVKFFETKDNKIYNRQQVYYSVIKNEPRLYQAIKTFIYLDTIIVIIQEMKKTDFEPNNFIIASILDDIRYKLILLYEDVLTHDISLSIEDLEEIVEYSITIYYSYILGRPQTTISYTQLISFTNRVREFITDYLNKFDSKLGDIKHYKEGDVPNDNLLFVQKLKNNLPEENIDFIIGIRFGGIELPYVVKYFIYPKAKIKLEKISNYSDKKPNNNLKLKINELKNKNVLILDDGITTGRTAKFLIDTLKNNCNNIYFACLYYSGYKRIHQMQMNGHGGLNIEQLNKCCVLKETNYTASINQKTYVNKNGKFDKTKAKIEAKASLGQTSLDLDTQIEIAGKKDENTKKVLITCSSSYITESYDILLYIRNKFQTHPDYEIVDDWIKNRIEKQNLNHVYKEISGRNYLIAAITDIEKSDVIVLFCPGPSVYISSLFLVSAMKEKEILIFYRKREDIKDYESYKKVKLIQIKQIRTSFIL